MDAFEEAKLRLELDSARREAAMYKDSYEKMKSLSDRQEELIKKYSETLEKATA